MIDIAHAFLILEIMIHTILKNAQEIETKSFVKALKGDNCMPKEQCNES